MTSIPPYMTMNVAQTVDYLVDTLGGTATSWATWLSNDRKTGRTHQIPIEPGVGRPRYSRAVVDHFIDQRRAQLPQEPEVPDAAMSPLIRRAAKSQDDLLPGRPFQPHITAMTPDEEGFEGGTPYVLLVTPSPLALYKLTADQAFRLAARLTKAAERVAKAQGDTK